MTASRRLSLDLFSDIACPWCSIGEAHLRRALDARPDLDVDLRWRPFQLQPHIPREGLPLRPFFPDKFGGEAAMQAMFARVTEVGRAAGVPFAFDRLAGAPHTADAHRLVLLGQSLGRALDVARSLFDGYFAEGADLSDADVLVALAARGGVPEAEARAVLASDHFADEIAWSADLAARAGVRGVPLLVVDGRFALSGAQPPEAIVAVLERAVAKQAAA